MSKNVCENCGYAHSCDSAVCQHSRLLNSYQAELDDYRFYVKTAIALCAMMSQAPTLERVFSIISLAGDYTPPKDFVRDALLELLGF